MLLAQVDTAAAGAATDFAGKFGFPALLVVILLAGLGFMLKATAKERETREAAERDERKAREERDEKREDARRAEREADRAAHITALNSHTASLNTLGNAVLEMGRKVDHIADEVRDQSLRLVKGG